MRMMDSNRFTNRRNSKAVLRKSKTKLEALVINLHISCTPGCKMPKSIPAVGNEIWTVDTKLTWQTGPFDINIEHQNAEEHFACLTNECARKIAESTICELLMPFLYSKREIASGNFEEIVKSLNSTRRSSKFRTKFPDYLDGLEIGNFGLYYHADFDGWVEICCEIKWFGVGGDEEEEVEDEDEASNMAALGKDIMAFVTKRMEGAREE
ncbi:uncharacterized protein Bfra_005826 [Botrytis fragariae]|uniref:Uncharacterized protein n=1 Tax=Botrytis fragariae TaxID=1964551 RepID=A0A8H6ARX4_9HELO|nr:uncharacterized protein Bfra_005826 [Botrytis fragariae]KAF5872466.1 hypothetical protein Bfra_005826 [Botrytis fragariae]